MVEQLNILHHKCSMDKDMDLLMIGGCLVVPFIKWFIKFLLSIQITENKCLKKLSINNLNFTKTSAHNFKILLKGYWIKTLPLDLNSPNE